MSYLDPGACPACGSEGFTAHCIKKGCGWWECVKCHVLFNAHGGFQEQREAS